MQLPNVLVKICFALSLALAISPSQTFAQSLIINEVSNGPTGNQEFVEFVVVGENQTFDCDLNSPPCLDITGWIFDDNSGYHGTGGIADGALRFSNNPLWSCVPVGTIIVLYNDEDPNINLPMSDVSLADGNCAIVAPISDPFLFEQNLTTPGAAACSYPNMGWVAGGDWELTFLANSGDCARLVDLSGCEVFSVCWASCSNNTDIYFDSDGSGSQNVWYFNDGDPLVQGNWSEGNADGLTQETPGLPNNAANASFIGQFNNNCMPIDPLEVVASNTSASCGCSGTATAVASGSIGGYTYEWTDDLYNSIGQNTAAATGLCAGTYHVIATSSLNCTDTATVTLTSNGSGTITTTQNLAVCSNTTVTYPDGTTETVTIPTSQVSQLTSTGGCDSIITTNVAVVPFLASNNLETVCLNTQVTYPDGTSEVITGNTTQISNLTSVAGCDSVVTTVVTVVPNFILTETVSVCSNSTITYPDGSTEVITAATSHVSNLTNIFGCDSTITTNVNLSQGSDEQVIASACLNSSYTFPNGDVQVITGATTHVSSFTSASGCDSTITTQVSILPGPFSTESVELCPGDSYTFQDGTTQNNIQSNLVYLSVFPQTSGCDSIVETVVNVSFSQGIRFSYSPNPIGPFDFDTRLSVLNPESSNYDWSIFDSDSLLVYSASDSAFDYQFENIAQNFTVCVSAVTSAGCTDTTCQEVPVTAELTVYIPNAFTPEIDGEEDRINDIFLPIIGGAIVENYNLNIYDRWGKRLFVSDDVLVGWDGRFKERPIPSDVYVYNLTFTTKGLSFLHQYRGTITIVK